MRLPLFWKILLATLLPLVAFALLGFTTNRLAHRAHKVARQAHYLARQESEAELGRRLVAIAQSAAALMRAEDVRLLQPGDEGSRTYRRLRAQLRQVARRARARRLYLVDRQRRSLCDSRAKVPIGSPYYHLDVERELLRGVFRQRAAASMLFTGKDGAQYKTGFAPLSDEDGKVVAALAVEGSAVTFAHLGRLDAQLESLRAGLLSPLHVGLLVGAGLLVLVLVSLLLARSVTRPVRHLVQAAAAIGRGELEAPVQARSRDEIGVLAESMNRMRADLLARQQELQLMLSGIAHEVRNPLGGIKLFAGLLRDEVCDEPDRLEMVQRIQRELEYLERVVREFLDYARESALEPRPFDLVQCCRELLELTAADAEARQVRLRLEGPREVTVEGDPEKLRRALLNVLRNAIGASPAGATVTLTITETPREVRVACRDEGAGMAAAELDKIFNAFYTTRERGTGLGLALTQKIVAAHQGRVEVDSEPGAGSEFRFVLPRPGAGSAAGAVGSADETDEVDAAGPADAADPPARDEEQDAAGAAGAVGSADETDEVDAAGPADAADPPARDEEQDAAGAADAVGSAEAADAVGAVGSSEAADATDAADAADAPERDEEQDAADAPGVADERSGDGAAPRTAGRKGQPWRRS